MLHLDLQTIQKRSASHSLKVKLKLNTGNYLNDWVDWHIEAAKIVNIRLSFTKTYLEHFKQN